MACISVQGDAAWQDVGIVSSHLVLIRLWPLSLDTWACQDIQAVHFHDDRGPPQGSPWHLQQGVGSGVHESSGVFCRWQFTHLPLAAEPDGLPCQCGNVSSYRVRTDQHGNYCTGRGIKHYSPGAPVQMPALGCRARWAVVTVWTCEITQVQTAWQSLQRQWRWEPQPSSTFAIACKQRQASPAQQDAGEPN